MPKPHADGAKTWSYDSRGQWCCLHLGCLSCSLLCARNATMMMMVVVVWWCGRWKGRIGMEAFCSQSWCLKDWKHDPHLIAHFFELKKFKKVLGFQGKRISLSFHECSGTGDRSAGSAGAPKIFKISRCAKCQLTLPEKSTRFLPRRSPSPAPVRFNL